MWISFWVTVGFGVVFLLVEIGINRPLPFGVGVIPATAISFMTNGWEGFWHWRVHHHETLCIALPSMGRRQCWDASSQRLPDAARPPEPPGWVEVIMPWFGKPVWEWLLTSVTIDLAGAGAAAGLVWLALRPFGHHEKVEKHLN
jgi:hypothetical protein